MENQNNIINFIQSIKNSKQGPEELRMQIGCQIIIALLGVLYGCILGHYWKIIGIVMLVICVFTIIIGCVILRYKFTLKIRLMAHIVSSVGWEIQLVLFSFIIYSMSYGINLYFFVFFLAPLLVIAASFVMIYKRIKCEQPYDTKGTNRSVTRLSLAIYGVAGMNFGRAFLKDLEYETVIIVVLLIMLFLCCVCAIGALHFLRLYYLCKCEKMNILLE